MNIIKSQKGSDQLCHQGFIYRKNTLNKATQNWRCIIKGCRGTVTTAINYQNSADVIQGQKHSHAPDVPQVKAKIAVNQMKGEAQTSNAPPRRIIASINQNLESETAACMPKRKALQKSIQRIRQKKDSYFPEPDSIADINLPEDFKTITVSNEKETFLLNDDASDSCEILIFASKTMLDQLAKSKHWMCDGTFKFVPKLFYQLYTIHAIKDDYLFACVYILLANKTKETYIKAFRILKDKRPDLEPETVTTDFEKAAIDALKIVFDKVQPQGCFFHLSQAIWRKIQSLGLTNSYVTDDNSRLYCKLLAALAFLPSNQITQAFEEVSEKLEDLQLGHAMQELYEYFEDTYIGRPHRRGRKVPLFSSEIWNCKQRTDRNLPRTTNKIEGWHRAIQTLYDSPHPSLWRFLTGIQQEEAMQRMKLNSYFAGERETMSKKAKTINSRIETLKLRHQTNLT